MRIGVNPEKLKNNKLHYYKHRVIIPIYIPNLEEDYYKNAFEVFQKCIHSLCQTIDKEKTVITVIDNKCHHKISSFMKDLLLQNKINKLVNYQENKGKVYTILSEIKASYEPYLTITDADVFFMNNWEGEVFKIFNGYPKAALVSPLPCPIHYKYLNRPLLVNNFFRIKLKDKIGKKSFTLFEQGVNPKQGFFEGKKWSWKNKQYIITQKNKEACVGATHFVCTLKREYLNLNNLTGPEFVFRNGDEKIYLEKFIEENGGYRLSTIDTYAYHMGNTIDRWITEYVFSKVQTKVNIVLNKSYKKSYRLFTINKIMFKILSKIRYNN